MMIATEIVRPPRADDASDGPRDNPFWPGAHPQMSVLIPFFRDDPAPLLTCLDAESERLAGRVELVLLDDRGGDDGLSRRVETSLDRLQLPARLLQPSHNLGRAKGRNLLVLHARGRHLLFLDSDMLPDGRGFLAAYLAEIVDSDPAVVFGGFSVTQAPQTSEHALHRALASRGDCLPAATRARSPQKYVFTSNLLVRRDVFQIEAFDESFSGWGWEDVEWGVRVGRRFQIDHIDNPATHLGLDTGPALAAKYEQSAANFARLARLHPDVVARFPSHRLARMLKHAPGRTLWRPVLKRVALDSGTPMVMRIAAMKLYRAALYAEMI